jgi:hypothetical protein
MTHDELLAGIKEIERLAGGMWGTTTALRAVVELHKPYKVNDIFLCDVEPLAYPCPTIQAIEKELK